MSEKLKACPFCNGESKVEETEGCDYIVSCRSCGCYIHDDMKWSEKNYNAVKNVTEKWNSRPLETELLEALKWALEELEWNCDLFDTASLDSEQHDNLIKAREAIEKAEGMDVLSYKLTNCQEKIDSSKKE